jgi:hypothetical protein
MHYRSKLTLDGAFSFDLVLSFSLVETFFFVSLLCSSCAILIQNIYIYFKRKPINHELCSRAYIKYVLNKNVVCSVISKC